MMRAFLRPREAERLACWETRLSRDASHWIQAVQGKRALLVGDLILDRYLYGDAERISPEAPVPVLRAVESREAVGGAANVAACLRALGCEVICLGVIGVDGNGRTLRQMLSEMAVDTSGLVEVERRPTTTKTRLVGLAQHRHRQQLLRVDEEVTTPLPSDAQDALGTRAVQAVRQADVICIEDYDKGAITEPLVQAIVETARKLGKSVFVDPARLSDYRRYRAVNVLTPNRAELSLAVGRLVDRIEDLGTAALEVLGRITAEAMVVTADRDGCIVVGKDGSWTHVPTTPRSVYDNTGAGDAVLAMLAAATAAGAPLEDAARLANVAGGLEVEKFGCVPITADEVLAELRLEDRRRNGKLRSREELLPELALRRDRGETIAFTNGCYDLLHAGHVDFLQRCRMEASVLVVGLNEDASVRAQAKGEDRPINPFADRARVLGALECVDYVVGFCDATPDSLIRAVRPDVLLKGEDWAGRGVVGASFVESYGGRVRLLRLVEGLSTTSLIERIRRGAGCGV